MSRLSAEELLRSVLDDGTFRRWDDSEHAAPLVTGEYAAELAEARRLTGLDEAVVTGEGLLRGRRVAVIASEFSFLAGSIGVVAADRLVAAIGRATARRMPLLAATASGGTRMQEGALAFVQMVRISGAIAEHRRARLPYLVYLRHPTTGGVFASWGSLGHVTVAEPGALIGFLGPRVYEALHGEPFPSHVQRAEHLHAHGLVDAVLAPGELASIADRALTVMCAVDDGLPPPPAEVGPRPRVASTTEPAPAWESVTRSRRPDRPGVRELLRHAADDVLPLSGTGEGESEPGLLLALARFGGAPCVLLGQDRRRQTEQQALGPGALRQARRGIRLASELALPLVSVIDTPGAALSKEAEEGGLAAQIAWCLADLVTLDVPTVAVLLGEGSGGGALALLPADRVVAAEHAWLSPLPPEGASVIVHRDTAHAGEIAGRQGIRSADLLADGIVDMVVAERPDAADEPEPFCRRMGGAVGTELLRLLHAPSADRSARLARYRRDTITFTW
ncbi:MAG: acetyl-CoA carboxyl transferase [Streptosporangiales bacterium]|nr:acetyl-CoA carboxyl transferase [Streptosporangiales bacterium]